jgi:hypothetical protein
LLTKQNNPQSADQIDNFIVRLEKYIAADPEVLPFTFEIEDPAGNSFIKNNLFPNADPNLKIEKYTRTIEQLRMMGYDPDNAVPVVANTEEEMNLAVRTKFQTLKLSDEKKAEITKMSVELQSRYADGSASRYSAKETDKMLAKADEINKNKRYTAHKMDFTKPIEMTDVDGREPLIFRSGCRTRH